jgi:hypothetical protein
MYYFNYFSVQYHFYRPFFVKIDVVQTKGLSFLQARCARNLVLELKAEVKSAAKHYYLFLPPYGNHLLS